MKPNTSKYRYDRVTMGILMSDFAFSKGGTEPGDLFPHFELALDSPRCRRCLGAARA